MHGTSLSPCVLYAVDNQVYIALNLVKSLLHFSSIVKLLVYIKHIAASLLQVCHSIYGVTQGA